jgi:hypothetical protein
MFLLADWRVRKCKQKSNEGNVVKHQNNIEGFSFSQNKLGLGPIIPVRYTMVVNTIISLLEH